MRSAHNPMRVLKTAAAVCACMSLSSCSFYLTDLLHDSPKTANQGFYYMNEPADQNPFNSKADYNFAYNSKYDIKDETKNPDNSVTGKALDISAPIQIIEAIPGAVSRYEDNNVLVSINTANFNGTDAENYLWEQFVHFLNSRGIGIEGTDALSHTVKTDWFTVDRSFRKVTAEMIAENDNLIEYKLKYDVSFNNYPERQLLVMKMSLTNVKAYHEDRRIFLDADEFLFNRFTGMFANEFLSTLHTESGASAEDTDFVTGYSGVRLGKDKNGQYAWIVDSSYDHVWKTMVRMLPEYGFEIILQEKLRGIIDTDYEEPDEEMFENEHIDNFVIEDDKYRFQVGVEGKTTVITIFANNKRPLHNEMFLKMYPGFAKALEKELNK